MIVVFAVAGSNAMAANNAPSEIAAVDEGRHGVSAAIAQNTAMIETYGLTTWADRDATSAPRSPPTPSIAAMMPICPEGTPRAAASTMTTR